MKIQRMFKFALPALLLAAGISAYAAEPTGEVTLGNPDKTTVTWAEFAKVINDPTLVGGTVDQAIANALKDKNTAYTTAVSEEEKAKTALNTATSNQTTAIAAAKTAKDAYDAAEAELAE